MSEQNTADQQTRQSRSDLVLLIALGLTSMLLYQSGITARYPLMAGLQNPRGSWITLVDPTLAGLARHAGVYILVFILYLAALHRLVSRPPLWTRATLTVIVGGWLLCSGVLLGAYPGGESHDIFDYLFRGRMMVYHHLSPLAVTPRALAGTPYYAYLSWHDHVDTYGPLWEYASATVAQCVSLILRALGRELPRPLTCPRSAAACEQLAMYMLGYRLFAIAVSGICGALLVAIVKRQSPRMAVAALLAWLWNPLLLITTSVGAHNEILVVAIVLLSIACVQQRRWRAGAIMVVIAAHVKLTALLTAPLLLIWMVHHAGWRRTLRTIALIAPMSALLSWLLYLPLGGWATLPRMLDERSRYLANSLASLANRLLREVAGWAPELARAPTTGGATLIFGLCALIMVVHFWRSCSAAKQAPNQRDSVTQEPSLWRAMSALTIAYLIIGCFWFQHWYILQALAPAALLPTSRLTRVFLPIYSCGALCGNLVGDFVYPQIAATPYPYTIITGLIVATTLLPFGIAVLASQWVARWPQRG